MSNSREIQAAISFLRQIEDVKDVSPRLLIGTTIAHCGGSYRNVDPQRLSIAGITVATAAGTHNLVRAWLTKARAAIDG